MRKFFAITLSALTALISAACGSSGGGTVATPPTYYVAPPNYYNPNACQLGQVDAPGYGCLNRYSCSYGHGWVPGEGRCVPGTVIDEQSIYGTTYQGRYFGNMSITNQSQFEKLLKYANLCDPYWVGWNWGSLSCSSWSNRGFIELHSFGSTSTHVNLFVGAGHASIGYQPFYLAPAMNGQYIGFSQTGAVVDYNSSQGMQIVGVGPTGQDIGLRLIVTTGRLTDNSFQADVLYQNVKFATIVLSR